MTKIFQTINKKRGSFVKNVWKKWSQGSFIMHVCIFTLQNMNNETRLSYKWFIHVILYILFIMLLM